MKYMSLDLHPIFYFISGYLSWKITDFLGFRKLIFEILMSLFINIIILTIFQFIKIAYLHIKKINNQR